MVKFNQNIPGTIQKIDFILKANQDEINEYCKMVTVSFYDVVEVDVDMSSWRDNQLNQIIE